MRTPSRKWTVAAAAVVALTAGTLVSWQANAEPDAAALDWKPCSEDGKVDCATVAVPLDWSDPNGETIDIGLARRRATNPDERIGSILMDPGGPGGSGVQLVKDGGVFTGAVDERFDTIGFDPRGVNTSTQVKCDPELTQTARAAMDPRTPKEYERTVELSGELAADCREKTGPLYDHVSNLDVVKDMEAIRVALGEGKLNFVGYSYGTLMGQQYAEAYPDKIRAMVMDGNMDHSITSTYKHMATQVKAAEDIFVEFADWCDTDAKCALNGMDTRKVYGELRDKAKAGELTDPSTGDKIDFNTFSSFIPRNARPNNWAGLADNLKALYEGKGKVAKTMVKAEPINLPVQAMWCQDWDLPVGGFGEWTKLRKKLAKKYPNTQWTSNLDNSLMCEGYPGETTNPQERLDIDDAPPLVMLGNLHDPATVYSWSKAAAKQSGASLITYEGFGHTIYAYGRKSECVNDAVDDYLIDLKVPQDGLRCPALEKPGASGKTLDAPFDDSLDYN
ncbi:alpha/beta hydrolase [Stackebrandtia nassauensis]|uniref:TAP domain protein n=1 Tax=Stackebrandtia nassauensis (strain DSM 44728 / CIP 108903 / NRRL B-16338 / NBRC 102104 / LLR-40K-21) TaxID=446470 RepID=D3Q3T7_STANL|nr:alpha/beta hydrolase [Stackebrandtia nassauensis]ADD44004.1 TAP domain protein [Stackebrandtia nassauensis DSM 44728]